MASYSPPSIATASRDAAGRRYGPQYIKEREGVAAPVGAAGVGTELIGLPLALEPAGFVPSIGPRLRPGRVTDLYPRRSRADA